MIEKIFAKEEKYYKFYIFLPIFLWVELLVGSIFCVNGSALAGILFFFSVICLATSVSLLVVHTIALSGLKKQLEQLTQVQQSNLYECGIVKIWKVYLSAEFIVQYGMFTMQLIPISDIEKVSRNQKIRTIRAGGYGYSEEVDELSILRKNQQGTVVDTSKEMLEAIQALLDGKELRYTSAEKLVFASERPIEGITALAILGCIVLYIGGYARVLMFSAPTESKALKLLFLCGYEKNLWIGAVVLLIISMIGIFVWRFWAKRKTKFHTGMMTIWTVAVILILMYVSVEYENKTNEHMQTAQADYQLYQSGIYDEIIVSNIEEIKNPYDAWGDETLYERMNDFGIRITFIRGKDETKDCFSEFILIDENETWGESKYVIYYLPNTKLVVKMEKFR